MSPQSIPNIFNENLGPANMTVRRNVEYNRCQDNPVQGFCDDMGRYCSWNELYLLNHIRKKKKKEHNFTDIWIAAPVRVTDTKPAMITTRNVTLQAPHRSISWTFSWWQALSFSRQSNCCQWPEEKLHLLISQNGTHTLKFNCDADGIISVANSALFLPYKNLLCILPDFL